MNRRKVAAMMSIAAALAVAPTLVARGEDASDRTPPRDPPSEWPNGAVENCSTRSMADFPGAYSDPHNVIVGPLVLVGAGHTPARTVREYGGNKFPLLVRAGHRVAVALSQEARRVAGLGYGPLPQGVDLAPSDGHRVVTFTACRRGKNSGSNVDGRPVTFWSGFVLTSSPRCVPLEVWVDEEPFPRRIALRMGVGRCPELATVSFAASSTRRPPPTAGPSAPTQPRPATSSASTPQAGAHEAHLIGGWW